MEVATDLAPTGVLRASINLGNAVLAQGTAADPRGITVELARDLAGRVGVPLELICFSAARDSFAAVRDGDADLCFLAVDPARNTEIAFTAPYAVIEAVYAVPAESSAVTADDIDAPGVRVGVKKGSAYDLYLTRTLAAAEVVRGDEGTMVADQAGLEAAAGIRAPVTAWVAVHPGWRIVEPSFMQIEQALGIPRNRKAATVDFLREYVEARKADGFVADALTCSSRHDARVAPMADPTPTQGCRHH